MVNILIPPLRERREEIPVLVDAFLRRYSVLYRRPQPRPSVRLMKAFERHPFPGNVRELENMIKRMIVLESEDSIVEEILSIEEGDHRSGLRMLMEEMEAMAGEIPLREVGRRAALEAERETIGRVLHRTNWNRKQAARLLNVSYKTLLQKIRECGLEPA